MVFSTDWWLKRAVKFVLKRYLGRILRNEVDLEQLDVQLGRGTLELQGALLNCDYLNERLGSPEWEIAAGYVGCMRLVIPLANLSTAACSVELEEALLTVRRRAPGKEPGKAAAESRPQEEEGAPSEGLPWLEEGVLGAAAVTDGVANIAGGIESILQRLRLNAEGVTIRLELPPNGGGPTPLAVLHLERLNYSSEPDEPSGRPSGKAPEGTLLRKGVSFSGLTVELIDAESESLDPLLPDTPVKSEATGYQSLATEQAGEEARLRSSSGADSSESEFGSPFANVHSESPEHDCGVWADEELQSNSVEGRDARDVIVCGRTGGGCSGRLKLQLSWRNSSQKKPHVEAELDIDPLQVQLHPNHLLLLAGAASSLSSARHESQQPPQQPPPGSRSMLTDLLLPDTTAIAQDFLVQSWAADSADPHAESQFYDAESFFGGLPSIASASAASFFSAASGAWESRVLPPPPPQQPDIDGVKLRINAQHLGMLLFYPQAAATPSQAWPSQDLQPRLAVEIGDLALVSEPSSAALLLLSLHRVEAVEWLCATSDWSTEALSQAARISEALPPAHLANARPLPSSLGSGMPMQVWPVLAVAGGPRRGGGSPSCGFTLRQEGSNSAVMEARLQPVTVWISLPLITRLHSFLEPLILHLASSAVAAQQHSGPQPPAAANRGERRVNRMVRSLMADLEELGPRGQQPAGGSRRGGSKARLLLTTPHACVIMLPADRSCGDESAAALAVDLVGTPAPGHTLEVSEAANGTWDSKAGFSMLKAYLVRAESIRRHRLIATCLAEISPPPGAAACASRGLNPNATALGLDVRWQPTPASPQGLASAAQEALSRRINAASQGKAGGASNGSVDVEEMKAAAVAASPISISVKAPAIAAAVSQDDIVAVGRLVSPLLRWQAETAAATAVALGASLPLTAASPAVIELECGVHCELAAFTQGAQATVGSSCLFSLDVGEMRAFFAPGLDGRAASSTAALLINSLQLRDGQSGPLLFSSPPATSCLELRHASRQLAADSIQAEAQGWLYLEGATAASIPGDLTFAWVQQLASFFTLPPGGNMEADAASGAPLSCDWSILLRECAVRDEPADESAANAVAAALLIGSLSWKTAVEDGAQVVQLQNVSLLASEAGGRPPQFGPCHAVDYPRIHLASCGYACLAQEAACTITVRPPGEDGMHETELGNTRLHCQLTHHSLARARRLAERWAASFSPAAAPPDAHEHLLPPGEESCSPRVAVMAEVDENAFSAPRRRDYREGPPAEAATPGWTEAGFGDDEDADAPGGAPVIVEDFFPARFRSEASGSEESGAWYEAETGTAGSGLILLEEYVKQPPPGYEPPSQQRCVLGDLPEEYPPPVTRLRLRDLRLVIALCQAVPTAPGEEAPDAIMPRVEVDVEGLCVQLDTFDADSPYARRLAVSVAMAQLRDCDPRADSAPAWQRIFGRHHAATIPRAACMLVVELEAVRPDSGHEELRLRVSALPLRLLLDQDVLAFLQAFFAADANPAESPAPDSQPVVAPSDEFGGVFFQKCEIAGLQLVADYKPRRLDVAALRAGNLAEVLNATAWSGVTLRLPHTHLTGVHGWDALGSMLVQRYLEEISSSQVHSLIKGIKPLQSILRIGSAAGQLLSIPADALRNPHPAAVQHSSVPLSRQIQRGLFGLVRAILAETLSVSAGALGGIHLVLAGPSAASASAAQPGNMSEGMRQAADRLSDGFGEMGAALRAPFSSQRDPAAGSSAGGAAVRVIRATPAALAKPFGGGAAAARCALLGARNSLDPERYESKRLSR